MRFILILYILGFIFSLIIMIYEAMISDAAAEDLPPPLAVLLGAVFWPLVVLFFTYGFIRNLFVGKNKVRTFIPCVCGEKNKLEANYCRMCGRELIK